MRVGGREGASCEWVRVAAAAERHYAREQWPSTQSGWVGVFLTLNTRRRHTITNAPDGERTTERRVRIVQMIETSVSGQEQTHTHKPAASVADFRLDWFLAYTT